MRDRAQRNRRESRAVPGTALDTVVTAETPEGILLELRPAGLSSRFYAFLVDWLLRLAMIYAVVLGISFLQLGGIGTAIVDRPHVRAGVVLSRVLRAQPLWRVARQAHARVARGDG